MRALVYRGPEMIVPETMPDPSPDAVDGAVVQIRAAGICGSDLHIYDGHGFSPDEGYIVGHEAVGEVVEVGSDVRRFAVGDRVLVPASSGCTTCAPCRRGWVMGCETGSNSCYGLSASLQGSQAEAVAVPAADTGLQRIPDSISDEQALLLTDNLPTAYFGARRADIQSGDTVAIVGLGPVGLCAVESAFVLGASRVFAIDLLEDRREAARALGAEAIDGAVAVDEVMARTGGRGADRVVEAVGSDVTIRMALSLVRVEGAVSVVGVNQNTQFEFNMFLAQFRSTSFHIGLCSVQAELPALLPLVESGRIRLGDIVSHRMGLSEGEEAYRLFSKRGDGIRKIVLDPSR